MNLKELKEMIEIMNENGLSEIELEREGMKVKVKKAPEPSFGGQPMAYSLPAIPAAAPLSVPVSTPAPVQASADSLPANLKEVKSPMVGTFYRAPSPEAAPFAEIGQVIEVGQVVCIVEAMKLMNEIKSDVRGKVVEVCVDNTEPVEFGQVLFRLDSAK